jgi:predicted nucleic acid-binding protein
MGLAEELQGLRVCIDTAPFIYFIEKNIKYHGLLRPVFAAIESGKILAMTSTITLLEVLVLPFKIKNEALVKRYRELLLYADGLTTYEILHEVSDMASELRARYSIRTPDAIQWCGRFFDQ